MATEFLHKKAFEANDSVRYTNLDDFYPYHLSQHSNNMNRLLHYIGTIAGTCYFMQGVFYFFTFLSLALQKDAATSSVGVFYLSLFYMVIGFLVGYGFAWIGHFFFEDNKPAITKYAWMGFLCNYITLGKFLTGQIDNEFKKYLIRNNKFIPVDFL
jgi:hypothetical protein